MSEAYDVAVVACKSYDEDTVYHALETAISAIGGIDFIKPGMKVAIKANLVAAKKPESATATHPVMVGALARMIMNRGAEVIVGDSPGGLYTASRMNSVYSVTGMTELEKSGVILNSNFTQSKEHNDSAKQLKDFSYTAYLKDVDLIIDFAKLKTHGMMQMSGALKNMFGTIPGTTKPEYHCRFPDIDDFSDMLIDLYEFNAPCLALIDAVYGMEGNGPTAGEPKYVGALIASYSGCHADTVAAAIMGLDAEKLPLTAAAMRRGMYKPLDELKVYGNPNEFFAEDYKLIKGRGNDLSVILPKPIAKIVNSIFDTKPKLSPKKCIGCKVCYNTCPQKAITMENNKPRFNYKKCIRCFCCQEFCPKGALTVGRTWIAKMVNGR